MINRNMLIDATICLAMVHWLNMPLWAGVMMYFIFQLNRGLHGFAAWAVATVISLMSVMSDDSGDEPHLHVVPDDPGA